MALHAQVWGLGNGHPAFVLLKLYRLGPGKGKIEVLVDPDVFIILLLPITERVELQGKGDGSFGMTTITSRR